jgi:hypothetical protein
MHPELVEGRISGLDPDRLGGGVLAGLDFGQNW